MQKRIDLMMSGKIKNCRLSKVVDKFCIFVNKINQTNEI